MSLFDALRSFFDTCRHPPDPERVVRLASGRYAPLPGYEWLTGQHGDFRVRWRPGKPWAERKLVARDREGVWAPWAGYWWTRPQDPASLDVVWDPGRQDDYLHLVAGATEGQYHPAPGYRFVRQSDRGSLDVVWAPGLSHANHANVIAGPDEGHWAPATGYRWCTNTPGDFRVEPVSHPRESGSQVGGRASGGDLGRLRDLATLGLNEGASRQDIESAFRRLVSIHHPDRFAGRGESAVLEANRAFLLLRAAFDRLTEEGRNHG